MKHDIKLVACGLVLTAAAVALTILTMGCQAPRPGAEPVRQDAAKAAARKSIAAPSVVWAIRTDPAVVEVVAASGTITGIMVSRPHPDLYANPALPETHTYYVSWVKRLDDIWIAALASPRRFDLYPMRMLAPPYFGLHPQEGDAAREHWYRSAVYYRAAHLYARADRDAGLGAGHRTHPVIDTEWYGANEPRKRDLDLDRLRRAAMPVEGAIEWSVPVSMSSAGQQSSWAMLAEILGRKWIYPVYYHSDREWRLNRVPTECMAQLVVTLDGDPLPGTAARTWTPAEALTVARQRHVLLWPIGTEADIARAFVKAE